MDKFLLPIQVRWADLDPNFHVRHSVYYDWGAQVRVEYLNSVGLTIHRMQTLQTGPILFREECVFRKEIRQHDRVTIDLKLSKAKRDFSRFSIVHEIKRDEATLAAILTVDVAWLSLVTRKLTTLPDEDVQRFINGERTQDFEWM